MGYLDVKAKLDQYADTESQIDRLMIQKASLLAEATVPDDVQTMVASGMKAMNDVDGMFESELQAYRDEAGSEENAIDEAMAKELSEIVIPDSVAALLREIDEKRRVITMDADSKRSHVRRVQAGKEQEITNRIGVMKHKIEVSTNENTQAAFDAAAQRRSDIEVEFKPQIEAAKASLEQLEKEIKEATKEIGDEAGKFSVTSDHTNGHGKRRQAVYNKGRKSWLADRLEVYTENHPDIKDCYETGEASVSIKAI